MREYDISNTVAIVTGGSKGIGYAIGPYYIKTPLTEEWISDPIRHEKILSRTAIKRLGEPEDVSSLLLMLVSDASSYITGQTFYIDGGALAGWTDL